MEVSADSSQARRFARVPFDAPVRITRLSTGQTLELRALNLSESGIFVETVIPIAAGELFRVHVPFAPSGFHEVSAARVAWRRPFAPNRESGQPPGVGLSFLLMSPADRQALHTLVEDGGIASQEPPRAASPRVVVEPRFVDVTAPPVLRANWNGDAAELLDVGPFGWLLVVALALAAMASLLLGMQPASF